MKTPRSPNQALAHDLCSLLVPAWLLITALALTLGASFWFDLLNRLIDILGAGGKPPPSQGNNGKAQGSAAA